MAGRKSAGRIRGPKIGSTRSRKGGGGKGGFKSKAQWRMFFARGNKSAKWRTMAHKKAHKSRSFKSLPARKGGPTSRTLR